MGDPNPLVNGRGIHVLRKAGVVVQEGILEETCRKLNEIFVKYITTGCPFVTLKTATSLDGRIAAETGDSQWISNEESRHYVHQIRDQVDAILVGVGTALKDDPQLTTRLPRRRGKDPIRVIVDTRLKLPSTAKVIDQESKAPTIIATSQDAPLEKIQRLEKRGAKVIVVPSRTRVDLSLLMEVLGKQEITSVVIEGGSEINTSALETGIVDKVIFFYAPLIIGGRKSPVLFRGKGVPTVRDAIALRDIRTRRFGDDVMLEGYVKR
jgi:diaminohydroxyphosphoribosylaminopyrimidine deaminase/5-amino-6-(5-phosphoribosylamino)uracil reductase